MENTLNRSQQNLQNITWALLVPWRRVRMWMY